MNVRMDETFASGLRAALVAEVTARRRTTWWRRSRKVTATLGVFALAGAGTAVAATILSSPPGSTKITPMASVVSVTATGTQTVELGEVPAGANRIELRLTCLTAGTFVFADGASLTCDPSDAGEAVTTYSLPATPGQHSTIIKAGPAQRWNLAAQYATGRISPWGINADGKTFGVPNSHGLPDLVAVVATNGEEGYVYATQLQGGQHEPSSPQEAATTRPTLRSIPVYTADGHTVVGEFVVNAG